ncbi:MAG: hypothetical protein PUC47_02100, partial [Oscillospiraceae bacterium]|nr:hypothetical protein [Oscillospiraceae bacterium]
TNSKLDKTTVVKDIIADYFQLPDGANANNITVKTADCKSFNGDDPVWTNEQVLNSLSDDDISVVGKTISVKGFNFSENYVGKNTTTGAVHEGKKLIIEIPVKVRNGFLGGNNVPTNGTASGVYDKDGTLIENFDVPTVDVEIPDVTVTVTDKNVYLLGGLTTDQMKAGMAVKVGDVTLDMSADAENYGLEAWQNAYVDISIGDGLSEKTNLAEDDTYVVDVTVSPKTKKVGGVEVQSGRDQGDINVFTPELTFKDGKVYYGADAPTQAELAKNLTDTKWKHKNTDGTIVEAVPANMIGTAPTLAPSYTLNSDKINTKQDIPVDVTVKIGETDVTGKTAFVHTKCDGSEQDPENGKFLLHVFTPVLTFKDSDVYYGDNAPASYEANKDGATIWKHNGTLSTAEGVTMIGEEPFLTFTYTPDPTKVVDNKITTKQDIPVGVTVKVGNFDVTGVVEFKHTDCKTDENLLGGKFLLHVKTCQLTITKAGGAAGEPYVFTVYKDNAKYTEVTIKGNSSVTIYELPVGNYSIEEDTGWSWRYTATYSGNVTLSKDTTSGTIICTNTKKLPYWLNGFSDIIANISGERKEGGEE